MKVMRQYESALAFQGEDPSFEEQPTLQGTMFHDNCPNYFGGLQLEDSDTEFYENNLQNLREQTAPSEEVYANNDKATTFQRAMTTRLDEQTAKLQELDSKTITEQKRVSKFDVSHAVLGT